MPLDSRVSPAWCHAERGVIANALPSCVTSACGGRVLIVDAVAVETTSPILDVYEDAEPSVVPPPPPVAAAGGAPDAADTSV